MKLMVSNELVSMVMELFQRSGFVEFFKNATLIFYACGDHF